MTESKSGGPDRGGGRGARRLGCSSIPAVGPGEARAWSETEGYLVTAVKNVAVDMLGEGAAWSAALPE